MSATDWFDWHTAYDNPESRLTHRLQVVRERIRLALDEEPAGPVRVLSLVAGQGRDVIPVVAAHPRRADVTARLIELDPRNADHARELARAAGLSHVDVRTVDAAMVDGYADFGPADLLLLCGLFGNISDADIRRTVTHAVDLVRPGGLVIWTRYRGEPDGVPWIDAWFVEQGFERSWLSDPGLSFGVGVHRSTREPAPLPAGLSLFTFVGDGRRPSERPAPPVAPA